MVEHRTLNQHYQNILGELGDPLIFLHYKVFNSKITQIYGNLFYRYVSIKNLIKFHLSHYCVFSPNFTLLHKENKDEMHNLY
jgi:hypothetical protein